MKVQKTQEKVFTPVELNLVFETQEEYDVFHTLIFWNKTLPRTIYPEQLNERVILQDVMQRIGDVL